MARTKIRTFVSIGYDHAISDLHQVQLNNLYQGFFELDLLPRG